MNDILAQDNDQVLTLITRIVGLSPAEADQVTKAWKQASPLDRARAWARLTRATTEQERHRILAAASLARKEALTAAQRLHQMDWAFWAAASDAAAAVAAGTRIGPPYDTLTAPLAAVMPALAPSLSRTRNGTAAFSEAEPPALNVLKKIA